MWKPHCFHVATTWFPHGHHVVSKQTTWLSCGYYVVSMCTPCGFKVDTIWFPGWHNVVSRWTTQGFKSGYYVVSTGHHRVSTWMPCGVHMDTMCCWGNHMETSTKNSSAWSQLASLLKYLQWSFANFACVYMYWLNFSCFVTPILYNKSMHTHVKCTLGKPITVSSIEIVNTRFISHQSEHSLIIWVTQVNWK